MTVGITRWTSRSTLAVSAYDKETQPNCKSDLPPWGSVRSIAPSRYDATTAYVTVDFHQVNNPEVFVYRAADYGKTFKTITNGIPKSMLSYVHRIYEDPVRRGRLYLGTENATYVSFNEMLRKADFPNICVKTP